MKKLIEWIAIVIALILLVVGATFLYNKLKGQNEGGFIIDTPPQITQKTEADSELPSTSDVGGSDTQDMAPSDATDTESTNAPDSTQAPESTAETLPPPTNPAPDFTVIDKNGNEVKLSSLRGKPVVVNFWASWCYYCKVEMPDFEKVYKEYGDEVVFMMVNMTDSSETVDVAKKFIDSNGYTFPVYFDTKSEAAIAYSVTGLPATYLIGANGDLVAHAPGAIDAATLREGISLITK